MPAQLMAAFNGPKCCRVSSKARWTSSSCVTSTGEKRHEAAPKALATLWPWEVGRSQRVTLAPSRTNRSTVARPNPEAPPVTKATTFFIMAHEDGVDERRRSNGGGTRSISLGTIVAHTLSTCVRNQVEEMVEGFVYFYLRTTGYVIMIKPLATL